MPPLLSNRRTYRFDDFELQLGGRTLLRAGQRVVLGSKAFDVLACLVASAGDIVTKEDLLKAVWPGAYVEENNLSQQIFSLRKALGDRASLVVTIPGRGYQFTGQLQETSAVEHSTEIVVETVRERSLVVIEETSAVPLIGPEPLALPGKAPFPMHRALWVTAAVLVPLAAAGLWIRLHRPPPDQLHTVVVADFQNSTGDETFDRSLKRALEIDLGQSPTLSVMSAREGVSLLLQMGSKADAPVTAETAREICIRSNRQILLTATIAPVGKAYLLTLDAANCASGKKLAAAKAQAAEKEDVLRALDSVADAIRSDLGESAKSLRDFDVPIFQATTPSLEALRAYSLGTYLETQGHCCMEVLPFYQRAVELDPKFAMAWGAMANTYYNQNEFALASENYKRAFDLSDRVSLREKLILRAHYYGEGVNDLQAGIQAYRLWAAAYPHDMAPAINVVNAYTQIGQYPPAIEAGEKALQTLTPNGQLYSVLARAYSHANRFDDMNRIAAASIKAGNDGTGLHSTLLQVALGQGDSPVVQREIAWETAHHDSWYPWYSVYLQASSAAARGQMQQSEALFNRACQTALAEGLPEAANDLLIDQAQYAAYFGLTDAARKAMGRMNKPDPTNDDLAVLHAYLGDTADAETFLTAKQADPHPGTSTLFVTIPQIRASLALQRGKPTDAIADLAPTAPFEFESFRPPSLLAGAYLKAGQFQAAAAEYKRILANPGVNYTSPLYPLAHLGLARAYAGLGDTENSRAEYQAFLTAWKDADPALPPLVAARLEFSRLAPKAP